MSFDYSNPQAMNATFPGPEQKPRGWWSRNWKWFVPSVFLCMILICCGGPLGIGYLFFSKLYNSEAYKMTMQKIESNEELKQELGQPITNLLSPPPSFRMEENADGSGLVDARWEIEGPKGRGRAHVIARMRDNKWEIVSIDVTIVSNNKKIVLHDEAGGNVAPPFNPQGAAPPEESKQESAPQPDLTPKIPTTEETEPKK
ncbi:MAG: cytochrome c oxidase assembly factor Coa1 family protein [Thermoguttaceae bacterium]|jgi:hypothetical protein